MKSCVRRPLNNDIYGKFYLVKYHIYFINFYIYSWIICVFESGSSRSYSKHIFTITWEASCKDLFLIFKMKTRFWSWVFPSDKKNGFLILSFSSKGFKDMPNISRNPKLIPMFINLLLFGRNFTFSFIDKTWNKWK